MKTLVFLEDHEGKLQKDALGVLWKAASLDAEVEAVLLGSEVEGLAAEAGRYGAARVHVMEDVLLAKPLPQPRIDAATKRLDRSGEAGSRTEVYELGEPPARGDTVKIEDDGTAAEKILAFLQEKKAL